MASALQSDLWEVELEQLKIERDSLRQELSEARQEIASMEKKILTVETIKDDDAMTKFYTGFSSYPMFEACFKLMEPSASVMRYW